MLIQVENWEDEGPLVYRDGVVQRLHESSNLVCQAESQLLGSLTDKNILKQEIHNYMVETFNLNTWLKGDILWETYLTKCLPDKSMASPSYLLGMATPDQLACLVKLTSGDGKEDEGTRSALIRNVHSPDVLLREKRESFLSWAVGDGADLQNIQNKLGTHS